MLRRLISHFTGPVAMTFAMICLGLIFAFLMNMVIGRAFGAKVMGIYYVAISIITITAGVSRLGLDHVMLRLLPFAWRNGERVRVNATLITALSLILGATLLISVFSSMAFSHIPFSPRVRMPLETALPQLLLAVFLVAFIITFSSAIRAFGYAARSIFYQSVLIPALGLAGAILLWQINIKTFSGLLSVYMLSLAISAMLVTFFLLRLKAIEWRPVRLISSSLLGPGVPLMWVSIINISLEWIDFLILGIWADPASIGIYAVCVRISLTISLFLMAINTVITPKFSLLYAEKNQTELSLLATKWTTIGALAAFPVLLIFLFFPTPILHLFGNDFIKGGAILRILSVGQFINVVTGPVGYLLMMTEYERLMRNIMVITLGFSITANLIVAPIWGAIGVASVSLLSLSLMNLACFYFVRVKLNINVLSYLFDRGKAAYTLNKR